MKNALCFIAQAGRKYGTGHLHRCLEMAANCGSSFFLIDTDLQDPAPLKKLVPYPHKIISGEGREEIITLLRAQNFDALVIDCAESFGQAEDACSMGTPAFVLDNPRLGKKSDVYIKSLPTQSKATANFTGFWHTPVREDFFNLPEEGQGILITMGGSDPLNSAPKAARAFKGSGRPVTLIVGALSNYPPIEPYEGLTVVPSVPDLAPHFQKNSLVVCGPGMTLLEAQAAGKKTLVITHNPAQYLSLRGAKGVPILMGGYFLSPQCIQKASQKAQPTGLNIPEGFVFSSWCKQLIGSLSQRPASCPLCGSHQKNALLRNSEGTVFSCKNCKSRYYYALRRPEDESGVESLFKNSGPRIISQQSLMLRYKENIRRRLATLKKLSPNATSKGEHRLLDISLIDGVFVQTALDSGIKAWGLDMGKLHRLQDFYSIEAFDSIQRAASAAPYTMITIWDKFALTPKPLETLRYFGSLLSTGGVLAFCAPSVLPNTPPGGYFQMTAKGGRLLALRVGLKPLKAELVDSIHGEKYWEIYCARA